MVGRRGTTTEQEAARSPEAGEPAQAEPAALDAFPRRRRAAWRFEYALLVGGVLLTTGLAFSFFFFDVDVTRLTTYGYVGLFLVTFISAASVVLPMPGLAAIIGGGAFLDPVFGVPAPLAVGVVAGLGEALGEFTGYAMGFGTSAIIQERRLYRTVESWMSRNGFVTLLVLSAIPNPAFDIAGVAAGAVRMPLRRFFLATLIGKTVKNLYAAGGGFAGVRILEALFG